jgi:AcrR family transcriptional regulator
MDSPPMPEPTTHRGRNTKRRIVAEAAELMYKHGVDATSIDDVLAASATGKSQLYHYFSTKQDLVAAVLDHQLDQILDEQTAFPLDTWEGLHAWFETLVDLHETKREFHGCPLGSLAGEVLDHSEALWNQAAQTFTRWESALTDALQTMQDRGLLRADATPPTLAETTIAIMQGAYLLSATKRNTHTMRNALTAALTYLHSFAPSPLTEQADQPSQQPTP